MYIAGSVFLQLLTQQKMETSGNIKVCLATFSGMPRLNEYLKKISGDEDIKQALQFRGALCDIIPWNDVGCRWESYDVVICRSPWDYTENAQHFADWLVELKRLGVNLLNTPDIILNNMDKRYLFDLSKNGVNIGDTVFLDKVKDGEQAPDIQAIMSRYNWKRAFAKNTFGIASLGTLEINDPERDQHEFEEMLNKHPIILQEYEPGYHFGERCLIFLDGVFRYAVHKEARGVPSFQYVVPRDDEKRLAETVLRSMVEMPFIARVDLIRRINGELILGELGAVGPSLFIKDQQQAQIFADEILKNIKERRYSK